MWLCRMRLVIRFGGSVVASPLNPELIGKYVELLRKLRVDGHEIVAVVGGGRMARQFIQAAKKLNLTEDEQDELAIYVSRLVAELMRKKLGKDGCGKIPRSVREVKSCLNEGKIVVMGGIKPGMTTDTVAALVAGGIKADLLIKATDQEGIYTRDPRKYKGAKLLKRVKVSELEKIFEENRHKAGIHQILDPEAVRILKGLGVRLVVVNGFSPENVLLAVRGGDVGTVVEC